MTTSPVSYEQVFWQSRLSAAFRTGWACLMAGVMMQYTKMHSQWMAFPLFAYIMAVTVVGEASLGEALQSAFSAVAGIVYGALPTIFVLWVVKPESFSAWVTTATVAVSSFIISYSKMIDIATKRVACAQVVMIYIGAFSKRESLDPIMYPLRVAGTTAFGTACAVVALIFPIPRLACYQVQEKSMVAARLTSQLLRLLVDAFSTNDCKEANSLRFQAKSLSCGGINMLKVVEEKQEYLKWELPGLGCTSKVKALSKEFGKLRQCLSGMEMALKYSPTNRGVFHVLLKDPLLYLTEWTSLALKNAGLDGENATRNNIELIVQEMKAAVNSLDESQTVVVRRAYNSSNHELSLPLPSSDEVKRAAFRCHLPTFFFMFSMKLLCKETIDLLHCSSPRSNKVQEIVPVETTKQQTRLESPKDSDYCSQCSGPRTTVSMNVQEGMPIWKSLRKLASLVDKNRFIVALKCSLSLGFSVLTGVLISRDHGFWGGLAVAMSLSSSREATFKLANVRAQGTLAGSIYGVVASLFTQNNIVLGAIALIPWLIFTSFLRQSKMYGYAGGQSAVISALFILGWKNDDSASDFAMVRITETLIAIVCYIVVEVALQPRRAATIARKELVLSLSSLHDCTRAFISAQSSRHCIHDLAYALVEFKEKEKSLKSHIFRLRKNIEEAKTEPDFWFLPFSGTTYSKLLDNLSNIAELLHFATLSSESILEICSTSHVPIERIYNPIRDDLQEYGRRVSPPFQCFAEVLQVKCLAQFITQNHHRMLQQNTSEDLESGYATEPHCEKQTVASDTESKHENNKDDVVLALLKSFEDVVREICFSGCNNDLINALSGVAFCLDNIMKELQQLETSVHELLQWENPWSFIHVWEIHNFLNSRRMDSPSAK